MPRRVLRHAFTALSALSLLLFLAAVGLWVRSFWVHESLTLEHVENRPGLSRLAVATGHSNRGGVAVVYWWTDENVTVGNLTVHPDGDVIAESGTEPLLLHRTEWNWTREVPRGYGHFHERGSAGSFWNRIGFRFQGEWNRSADRFFSEAVLVVPHWALALLTAVLPAGWTWRRLRQPSRLAVGGRQCARCGYDLRARPERCPECGTPAAAR